jgi:hypothetical protein
MKKIFASGLLLLGVYTYAAPVQIAQPGVYITADLGGGILFTPDSNLTVSGGSFKRSYFTWSGGLGYNWALDSFTIAGLEADYFDNGQSYYTSGVNGNAEITSSAIAALLTFTTIWENGINVFVKAGPAYVMQKNTFANNTNIQGAVISGSQTKNTFQCIGVLGLGYYIAHNLNLFTDFTYVYGHSPGSWNSVIKNGAIDYPSLNAASAQIKVGLSYQF